MVPSLIVDLHFRELDLMGKRLKEGYPSLQKQKQNKIT